MDFMSIWRFFYKCLIGIGVYMPEKEHMASLFQITPENIIPTPQRPMQRKTSLLTWLAGAFLAVPTLALPVVVP